MPKNHRFRTWTQSRPLARSIALVLTGTWYATAPVSTFAAEPISARELPLPAAAPGKLIAQADTSAAPAVADPAPAPAAAETSEEPPALIPPAEASQRPVSESVTINLINRLVERGVLTKEDSADLIRLAEQDAAAAKAEAAAQQQAAVQAAVEQAVAAARIQAAEFTPDPALMPMGDEDALKITYIPEPVKAQLREDIKHEILSETKEHGFVGPNILPEWVTRIRLFGDIRVRYDNIMYPDGNDNTGAFPNFNAINTGRPFDVAGTEFSPQLNVDEDRVRFRLRARFGLEAQLGEGFTAGFRIATGETNSPTSTNQSMGLANQQQGGNFSKYAIWLDRAFLKYELTGDSPDKYLGISVGRFDNPFFSVSEIIWDDDLGFDGIALQASYPVTSYLTPFLNAGAFIVFNTDLNFSSNRPDKFPSDDKYLYAAQLGTEWKISKDWKFKIAAAYYKFENIEGRLSDPFTPLSPNDNGNTDNTRPSFAQKGNTYMALRNIVPNALNDFGTINQWQYFGLATPFEEVGLTARLDYTGWDPIHVTLTGEWVKNIAFNRNDIENKAVNNRGPDRSNGLFGKFEGGDTAWIVGVRVGKPKFERFGDWALGMNYRYVESDAVVDGFADSEFGGGGTNVKGYSLFGSMALSKNISLGLRWMSANEVAGPQFKHDILQVDLNGSF